jgi:small acid-soluble spore protein I (minor)
MNKTPTEHIIKDNDMEARAPCMNITLRQAIIQRVHNKSNEELFDVIEDSIGGEERVLPGLGVLFEIIWRHCDADTQNELVSTLKDHLH